jgi:hypothetical protein
MIYTYTISSRTLKEAKSLHASGEPAGLLRGLTSGVAVGGRHKTLILSGFRISSAGWRLRPE